MIYLTLFWEYFKIGLFTIGGGYAMFPMVQQAVTAHGWMTDAELIDFVGVAESTPGPFAINLATFVGVTAGSSTSLGVWGGLLGAIVATVAVVLPSLVIIIVVTKLFARFKTSKVVQGALYGIRPVVVGLVLSAVFTVGCTIILPNLDFANINAQSFDGFRWIPLVLMALYFVLSRVKIKGKKIHPVLLILSAAALGVIIYALYPPFVQV